MRTYFYTDGKTNFGPFTIEELREKNIAGDTFVWTPEFTEWKKAGTIPELEAVLISAPPQMQQSKMPSRRFFDIMLLVALAFWLFELLIRYAFNSIVYFGMEFYEFYPYFNLLLTGISVCIPVIIACSIHNKMLRIIAIVISLILAVMMFSGAVLTLTHMRGMY